MEEFNGLTISQLKVCYDLFGQEDNSFYLSNSQIKQAMEMTSSPSVRVDPENFNRVEVDSNLGKRILFYPVTLYPNSQPKAEDLHTILKYFTEHLMSKSPKCARLVIPIGEISKPPFISAIHHMVTLIIDFLPQHDGDYHYEKPPVNIKIVDSFKFSFPGCHQTAGVITETERFFTVVHYGREYLGHQNWLDRRSCCYFTMKVIRKALVEQIDLNQTFVKTVPNPNTWIFTSENWLTKGDRKEICDNLISHFRRIESSTGDLTGLMGEIIEL